MDKINLCTSGSTQKGSMVLCTHTQPLFIASFSMAEGKREDNLPSATFVCLFS
jgi:hypothetical protein